MKKKVVPALVVVFLLFFIVSAPTAAAATVGNVGDMLAGWAQALITFFTALSG